MLIWESGDITIAHLNTGTINYRNELHGFVGISLLTVLYSIGMATLGVSGLNLPPFLVILQQMTLGLSHYNFIVNLIQASIVCWSDADYVGIWGTNHEC